MKLVGKGYDNVALTDQDMYRICEESFEHLSLDGKRVLVLIPDHTRHAPIPLFFKTIFSLIGSKVSQLDYLIATGTHLDMSRERILQHIGITESEYAERYSKVNIFNHAHKDPDQLAVIGKIPADEISQLSDGLFNEEIEITINKRVLDYDHLVIVSPVVPHETAGFSGGNKYFFPGIGGLEIIRTFHWLGAVITNPVVNGVKDTAVRRVINRGCDFIPVPRTCLAFAVRDDHRLACLFAGPPEEAWDEAADYSAKLHVQYKDRPAKRVIGIPPSIYEELWVAGKVMYKLEPIIADGGELIIYGPHIKDISFVHGEAISRIGYHVRDYFLKQWEKFSHESKLILAHSTNVRGIGKFENGKETPRVQVTLATGIPEEVCRKVNLGFLDHRTIDLQVERARQDEDNLVVEKAGQILFRLRDSNN